MDNVENCDSYNSHCLSAGMCTAIVKQCIRPNFEQRSVGFAVPHQECDVTIRKLATCDCEWDALIWHIVGHNWEPGWLHAILVFQTYQKKSFAETLACLNTQACKYMTHVHKYIVHKIIQLWIYTVRRRSSSESARMAVHSVPSVCSYIMQVLSYLF
jgi:hypothetical protein